MDSGRLGRNGQSAVRAVEPEHDHELVFVYILPVFRMDNLAQVTTQTQSPATFSYVQVRRKIKIAVSANMLKKQIVRR